jgi:hypothetical protein
MFLGGLLALAVIVAGIEDRSSSSSSVGDTGTNSSVAASAAPADSATGNVVSDALRRQSPAQQAHTLGKVVGEGCRGKSAFYDGIGRKPGIAYGHAFWSVSCQNGKAYMVNISPNDKDNQVLECSIAGAIGVPCFTRF